MANEKHVVTGEARLSYIHVLKPHASRNNPEEKYSLTVLIPKSDIATKQRIDAAIEAAAQDGSARLWGGRPPRIDTPVHDGDGGRPSDGMPFGAECKGHWVFTASCKADRPPRVVDANVQDILDPTKVYSGVYGRVGVDFFPYNSGGKKGVGCGLTNVQILRDGEALDNRTTAEDDFGAPQGYQMPQQPAPQYVPPQQAYGYAPPQQQAYGYASPSVDPITGLPR